MTTVGEDDIWCERALAYLANYRPRDLDSKVWRRIEVDAKALVGRPDAGVMTVNRVKGDLQTLAKAARILTAQGQEPTLASIFSEAGFISIDQVVQREQPSMAAFVRGNLRRLAAVHQDLPWRRQRRADGGRTAQRPKPSVGQRVAVLIEAARAAVGDADADAVLTVTAAVDSSVAGECFQRLTQLDPDVWQKTRAFSKARGLNVTKQDLAASAVYQALDTGEPVAVIAREHQLSRENLELGLHLANALPQRPAAPDRELLRGQR
jgi:hypothetical protein